MGEDGGELDLGLGMKFNPHTHHYGTTDGRRGMGYDGRGTGYDERGARAESN